MNRDEQLELFAIQMGTTRAKLVRERTEMPNNLLDDIVEEYYRDLLGASKDYFESKNERARESNINKDTYYQRETAIDQFVNWYKGNDFYERLDKSTFMSFISDMLKDGYSGRTMKTRYWQLVKFATDSNLNSTIENELRSVDHMVLINEAIDDFNGEGQGARSLEREEYEKLIEGCDNRRLELMMRCCWQMGLRAKECVNLRRKNIDWKNRKVTVRTAKQQRTKKRTLSINLFLKNELKKWVEAERHEYAHASDSIYLFPTNKSDKMYPQNFTSAVRELADEVGIQKYNQFYQNGYKRAEITVHSFRKSFGLRRLKDPDGNLRKVQILLGHSNTKVTENYLDLTEDDLSYNPK